MSRGMWNPKELLQHLPSTGSSSGLQEVGGVGKILLTVIHSYNIFIIHSLMLRYISKTIS